MFTKQNVLPISGARAYTVSDDVSADQRYGKRCRSVAPKLDKMSTIAVIISQYLKNDLRYYHECFSR